MHRTGCLRGRDLGVRSHPTLKFAWFADRVRLLVVDVYVRYMREKIDRPFGVVSIETVRGSGYRLCASAGREQ